jgi:hypothetical protein
MESNNDYLKCCVDCRKPINFKEFCQNNPALKSENAKALYYNPIISIYCSNCYFERPEKPFKLKRRDLSYYKKNYL